jgi:hypothetical protein
MTTMHRERVAEDESLIMAANKEKEKENRKTKRVTLEKPLKVVMGSIGAQMRYELLTRSVSINGFFLDFDKPGRFPFTPSSIMEVWLELVPGNAIFFNGKMARVVRPDEPAAKALGPGIAIKIVQIDRENEAVLSQFIDDNYVKSDEKEGDVA